MEDKWLEMAQHGELLSESDVRCLCDAVKSLLMEESNVHSVPSPVTVCGDIHGQFYDLLELFRTGGQVPDKSYVFMGDFVDRGKNSVETIVLLLALKARYPDSITLLRGNHETRQVTQVYGFFDEVMQKYGNSTVWKQFCEVFDFMTLSCTIDGRIFCVHGGLSPQIVTLDEINCLHRKQEVPHEGAFCDLMWSDPEEYMNDESWVISPRGAGYLFGERVSLEFNHVNGLDLICRAHQLVQEGFRYHFSERSVITVWSAPNYCGRCGNVGAILDVYDNLDHDFQIFSAVASNTNNAPGLGDYFT